MSLIYTIFPNLERFGEEFIKSIGDTCTMVIIAGFFSFFIGVFFGVVLTVTKKDGLLPNKIIYNIIDKVINVIRSIPFIIFIIMIIPLSRLIVGTGIGVKGVLIPLILGTVPFFARQIETAIAEVDKGLIEAAQSMGNSPMEIIFRVYLKESIPSITRVTMITLVNLVGLTAMAGTVGGGGLGDFAIRYGYQQHLTDITYACVIIILLIVSIIQVIGNFIIQKTTH